MDAEKSGSFESCLDDAQSHFLKKAFCAMQVAEYEYDVQNLMDMVEKVVDECLSLMALLTDRGQRSAEDHFSQKMGSSTLLLASEHEPLPLPTSMDWLLIDVDDA